MAAPSFGDLTTAADTVLLCSHRQALRVHRSSTAPARWSALLQWHRLGRLVAGGRLRARRDEVRRRTRPFDGPDCAPEHPAGSDVRM